MADKSGTDLLMQFVLEGKAVWAECALEIDPDDTLLEGFGQNTGYDNYADFFEVSGFDFGMSLKESDNNDGANSLANSRTNSHPHAQQNQQQKKASMPFARWRSAEEKDYRGIKYPLEFDEFNFERTVDAASTVFFEKCCNSVTFDTASIVKRISVGDSDFTDITQYGILRIDFKKVLITNISWDDGDVVKEKCSFICQQMTIKYRPQMASGEISAKGQIEISWPDPRALAIRTLGRN